MRDSYPPSKVGTIAPQHVFLLLRLIPTVLQHTYTTHFHLFLFLFYTCTYIRTNVFYKIYNTLYLYLHQLIYYYVLVRGFPTERFDFEK